MKPRALVIGTTVANSAEYSGASIRFSNIKSILSTSGYEVTATSIQNSKNLLHSNWDLISVVSYSSSKILKLARRKTKFLWFDATDSWKLCRISLFKAGDFRQILALFRELIWLRKAPKLDLLTFISARDSNIEKKWWEKRITPLILPVFGLKREIKFSDETKLVFVGDGNYLPNKKAMEFLEDALVHIPPNIIIHVFGKNLHSANPRIICHGYVANEEIYFKNDIHLAPVFQGAGIKLKVAIPLTNGIRVITTHEGSSGLNPNPLLKVVDSVIDFASEINKSLLEKGNIRATGTGNLFLRDDTSDILYALKVAQNVQKFKND